MGLFSQAQGAKPVFLSNSYLTRDSFNAGGIAVSSGDAYKARAYDMTRGSRWLSVGSSDAVTETYQAKFYLGSLWLAQNVDCLILADTNLKNFKFEYSVGGGALTIFPGMDYRVGTADFAGTDLIVPIANAVSADLLLLTAYRTQVANQEKYAKILACAVKFQAGRGLSTYKKTPIDVEKEVEMGDKSTKTTYVMRSPASYRFYRAQLGFLGCSEADRAALEGLATLGDSFVFLPEPGDKPADLFRCKVAPNTYQESYLSLDRAPKLWRVDLAVKEVGGF